MVWHSEQRAEVTLDRLTVCSGSDNILHPVGVHSHVLVFVP